jgi:hypothetical protein
MQKISTYLYPNRVQLLVDLAAFNVEYTNVYQRIVKIYNGIDNTIEFDIKNADQKRIDLTTLSSIQLNVMDATGTELPNSPYTVTPTAMKGIATVTIPQEDLTDLTEQFLKYSVTALKDGADVMLYADSRFGAVGTIELVGSAMPTFRDNRVYDSWTAEIDLKGMPIYHTSAIPAKFYEAVPTESMSFEIHASGFIGSVWIDATKNGTTNVEAWRAAGKPFGSWTQLPEDDKFTGVIPFGSNIPVGEYQYFRISYTTSTISGVGAGFKVTLADNVYNVTVQSGGTGYAVGAMIKVPGSQMGGVDGVNDLILTVTGVDASSAGFTSSYAVSSVTAVTWSGTAIDGTGTYLVTGTNIAGSIDRVIVS